MAIKRSRAAVVTNSVYEEIEGRTKTLPTQTGRLNPTPWLAILTPATVVVGAVAFNSPAES